MSSRERTGERDLTYSQWHREERIIHLLDGDRRAAYELGMVDIDGCEYCRHCSYPLALVETQRSSSPPKSARVMTQLAELAGVQAWSVSYVAEGGEIVSFQRRMLSPVIGPVIAESPEEYARWLLSLRFAHRAVCTARTEAAS